MLQQNTVSYSVASFHYIIRGVIEKEKETEKAKEKKGGGNRCWAAFRT